MFLRRTLVVLSVLLCLASPSHAASFTITWGTAPFTWTASNLGPNTFTMTDAYGFQVQVRMSITRTNGVSGGPFPDDLLTDGLGNTFGTQRSMWLVWNPNLTGGGIGGSPNVATMEFLNNGAAIGVNGLTLRASDIDAVDSNNASFTNDRCDHLTFTGNAGNPTLSAVTGSPTFLIGPGAGAGASPALAANQVQCNFAVSTSVTSPSSNANDNGTVQAAYPNGTSVATVQYDESIHNVSGITSVNALVRGAGVWAAPSFSLPDNTITLDKQTTATGFSAAGDVISYTYVITNNGPLSLLPSQNITINDSKIGYFTCPAIPAGGIASGGTHTCTANYTVTAADVTSAFVTNTATAGVGVGAQTFATRLQSNTDAVTVNKFATLTLIKTVTNDNGGTATTASVTLSATGTTTISGLSGNAAVTNAVVAAGTYVLAETSLPGYAAGAWSCTAGSLSGANLTLGAGQSATCTINNNDIAPLLTLIKTVNNDNGGTATTSAFTLTASGPTTITGISGAGSVTGAEVNAGTYALSESNLTGYAAGNWSCSAGTLTGASLVLGVGETATCTINNDDVAPILTLVKTVTDTSGGASTVPSFTLTATGPTTISGITGAAAVTNANVSAGVYALSESGPSGYIAETWNCTAGTLSGSNLTLAVGQTATCTINNIKLPTVTIRKISNGGIGAFNFTGSNGIPAQTLTTTAVGSSVSGSTTTLTARDTATTITETMTATFWQIQTTSCTGMGTGGTATLAGNVITLNALATAAGRDIICTFTNRRRPTVTVQKITTGAFGGAFSFADTNLTGTVANITTTAINTATPASPTRFIASGTGTAVTLTETSPLTFVPAGVTCSDANNAVSGNTNPVATSTNAVLTIPAAAVRIGADINCVFTNAQAVPQLAVTKTAGVSSVSTVGSAVTYTIAVNNSGNTTLNNIGVTDPLGTVICPSSGAATVTSLAVGATENCSVNYSVPQSVFDTNGGGDGDIDNTATASATYNSAPVSANGSATVGLVITPALTIDKIPNSTAPVNAGNTISYTYRVTNSGNVTMNNVTISDAHIGYGTDPVPGSESIYSDAVPTGNSTDAATNASWDVLAPGDVIEFTSNYVVVQADIDNLQ